MLSIVIPVNTYDQWAKDAINSCLRDTESLEIVIILSKKLEMKLTEIESELAPTESKKLKVLVQEGNGIAAAMNEGVAATSYEMVARLDSDDLMATGRLTSQKRFLMNNPDFVAIGGQVELIDMSGRWIRRIYRPNSDGAVRQQIVFGNCFTHSAMMFRKSVFTIVGGYDLQSSAEDFDLWSRMMTLGKMKNLDVLSCYSRLHQNQMSVNNSREVAKSNYKIIRRNILFLDHQISNRDDFLELPFKTRLIIELKALAFFNISEARKSNRRHLQGRISCFLRISIAFALWPGSISRYLKARTGHAQISLR